MFLKCFMVKFAGNSSPVYVTAIDGFSAQHAAVIEMTRRSREHASIIKDGRDPDAIGRITRCVMCADKVIFPESTPSYAIQKDDKELIEAYVEKHKTES